MQRLKDKVAVITGGNSGIGEGIAKYFHQEGARVVICGRDAAKLAAAKQELGEDVLAVQADVTRTEDLKKLFAAAHQQFGKIDILVVNSGVGERLNIRDVTEEKFDRMVDINYRGAYFTIKYSLDYLSPQASIILIASLAAHVNIKNHSVYGSTKSAVVKLAKHLAYDLAPIRINSISPGYIRTPIFDSRLQDDPDYLARRTANIPLKRIGIPQDIAQAALFLASDEASYITGADLMIDGGYASHFQEA